MGKKQKKVSIILVNYNGIHDTVECIKSIQKSDYTNFEIIVVDNCSDDKLDILYQFEKVVLIENDENVGFGIANNIGAEYASKHGADYIMCLNNDTVINNDTIKKLVTTTNDTTMTTGAIYYYNSKELWYGGGEVSKWKGNFRHKQYTESKNVTFLTGCCFMMTTNTYRKLGLFEKEYFMYYEDADFSLKALQHGIKLRYLSDAIIWHKVGKSINRSIGAKDYYLTRNRLYIISKYSNYFKCTAMLYFVASRLLYILFGYFKNENVDPIISGIKAYRNKEMGKKKI
ncbi:hypothetical protein SAMN02910265_00817 [Ruminococcus flavefaciens]|uniref:Glycosyltransferase 2-like domain-containing protein n=1 Tax=Ruminococcus flavefaciens TaxID=1265 RepID=A0A1H6ICV4_RUMFL|nr:glycosyltransferase family 2 protein [Ruminococcus flavefaciens]SEH46512.1 hypothetical protein SAMN02910265_00817 [Ruminococcus flavefaciens]